jgi:outer membrane protein, multidrug efflux system
MRYTQNDSKVSRKTGSKRWQSILAKRDVLVNTTSSWVYVFLFLFLLSGCMVGPKYQNPDTSMPSHFEELSSDAVEKEVDLSFWWKQFEDPVLDALIEEALAANYDLKIALEKIEQTRAQYRIERSHLWPEIDLNATAIRSRISQNLLPSPSLPSTAGAATTSSSGFLPTFLNIFSVGFDAIWEFDFFGKHRHAKKSAHYLWEATKEDYQSVLISLLSEVAVNYVTIRAVQNKIVLMQEKIKIDEDQLAIVQSLFNVGIDDETQITTLVSKIETDRAELPVLMTSLKQTVYALAYLLGRQPEGLIEWFDREHLMPSAEGKLPVGLPSDLLRRRPDVRSAERQLAAATEQTGAAIADYFPHFSLTGISFSSSGNNIGSSATLESDKLSKLFQSASRMLSFGLGMNWDMIDFGRVRANVDVKKSLQKQALMAYEQAVIGSLKDVESALIAYSEEKNRRKSLVEKMDADQHTCEIFEALFEIGLADQIQVIETKKAWIESKKTFIESEQSLMGDLIAVYKAIGGNWN